MRKGFTLVEIMIVVAIIALLAAIAIPNLLRARLNANDAASKSTAQALVTAIESYAAANDGIYPDDEGDLTNVTPPYLNEPLDGQTKHGYGFAVTWGTDSYTVAATASNCNVTGTQNYTITTGNVWTEAGC